LAARLSPKNYCLTGDYRYNIKKTLLSTTFRNLYKFIDLGLVFQLEGRAIRDASFAVQATACALKGIGAVNHAPRNANRATRNAYFDFSAFRIPPSNFCVFHFFIEF